MNTLIVIIFIMGIIIAVLITFMVTYLIMRKKNRVKYLQAPAPVIQPPEEEYEDLDQAQFTCSPGYHPKRKVQSGAHYICSPNLLH